MTGKEIAQVLAKMRFGPTDQDSLRVFETLLELLTTEQVFTWDQGVDGAWLVDGCDPFDPEWVP